MVTVKPLSGEIRIRPNMSPPARALVTQPAKVLISTVCIVDDDWSVREALGDLLQSVGYRVVLHRTATDFLKAESTEAPACLVADVRLPGTSGLELQDYLARTNVPVPVILVTGFGDIPMSVRGMKAGAVDFLTKPIRDQDLLDAVAAAVRIHENRRQENAQIDRLRKRYASLTLRERQVVSLVSVGLMNKQVANELSISEVTVKMHRGSAMRKLEVRSVARLARIAELLHIPYSEPSRGGGRTGSLPID